MQIVLKEDTNSASAYSNLGNVHLQTGRAALALQDFSRAVALAPEARHWQQNGPAGHCALGVLAGTLCI